MLVFAQTVMCKVGKLISAEHQLCLAHGVHLAVHDVLYKRISSIAVGEGQEMNAENQEVEHHDHANESDDSHDIDTGIDVDSAEVNKDSDGDDDVSSPSCGSVSGGEFHVDACDSDDETAAELSEQYRHIIEKVRKIVKMFRRSPVKNDSILQK